MNQPNPQIFEDTTGLDLPAGYLGAIKDPATKVREILEDPENRAAIGLVLRSMGVDIAANAAQLRNDPPNIASSSAEINQKTEQAAFLAGGQSLLRRLIAEVEDTADQKSA